MLSYMLPADDKPPPVANKNHLQLNLAGRRMPAIHTTNAAGANVNYGVVGKKIMKSQSRLSSLSATGSTTISTDSSVSSFSSSDLPGNTPTDRPVSGLKTSSDGSSKHASLKRVSFGSSKGSMVETLIYETPLAEEPETSPILETSCPFPSDVDAETLESTKVRVSFFESEKRLVPSLPSPEEEFFLLDAPLETPIMSHSPVDELAPSYNRQTSTESGWDNPFRPDGDLSREADEIVELIKGGKPITPTPGSVAPQIPDPVDQADHAGPIVSESVTTAASAAANGTAPSASAAEKAVEVQRVTVGAPADASQVEHVNIKKKPKCKCCVIQ